MLVVFAIAAVCIGPPVDGPIISGYAPVGEYGGHWGVDYAAILDEVVRSPATGRVTFAGSVAGMRTITIEPVAGFKVSVSYLSAISVDAGQWVTRGSPLGTAGAPHGRPGVHLSTRIAGRYVDPETRLGCLETDISRALRLVTPVQPYPRRRAHRNPWRDLRPDPHRPSPRSRVRPPPIGARSRARRSRR